jgi:hypothetical protein
MRPMFSAPLNDDIAQTMEFALQRYGIVNIPLLAEQIRKRNEVDNVALEDIAERLMQQAQSRNAAMEFDSPLSFGAPASIVL